jgi:hypothetical protein
MSGYCPQPGERNLSIIVASIRDLFAGRSNRAGTFTCATSAATTTVTAPNCGLTSIITITPTTANAGAELASGNCYISATALGTFTVHHTNSATTGRTFNYAIES